MTAPYIWYDRVMKSWLAAALLIVAAFSAEAQQRTRLQVYTTLEVANIGDFKKAFEAENRDLEISWLRDSTGSSPPASWPSRAASAAMRSGAWQ
jgi:hypothetical protein